jgi:outer membrane lipopolysaccharide assembly protein LptE/RlpB
MDPDPIDSTIAEPTSFTLAEKRVILQRSLMLHTDECELLYPTERDVDKALAERDKMLEAKDADEAMGWDNTEPAPKVTDESVQRIARAKTKKLRKVVEGS